MGCGGSGQTRASREGEVGSMAVPAVHTQAEALKAQGNQLFMKDKLGPAIDAYTEVTRLLRLDYPTSMRDFLKNIVLCESGMILQNYAGNSRSLLESKSILRILTRRWVTTESFCDVSVLFGMQVSRSSSQLFQKIGISDSECSSAVRFLNVFSSNVLRFPSRIDFQCFFAVVAVLIREP